MAITTPDRIKTDVAEKLGWKIMDGRMYSPDRDLSFGEYLNKFAFELGQDFINKLWEYVPDYHTDINVALELFDALPDNCTPRLVRMKWPQGHKWKAAIIVSDGLRVDYEIEHECESAAEAICHVWLDYQNYHSGN